MCGDPDLPPNFWDEFMARLREEQAKYDPVTEVRMFAFIVSRVHSRLIEEILQRAQDRGLIKVETRYSYYQGPKVPPAPYRVFIPIEDNHVATRGKSQST